MVGAKTRKVFISFHHRDEVYKTRFARIMDGNIVDKSVEDGDIDSSNNTDRIRRIIRDNFIADATVTVVLIGECTWQRKHVDWEVGSSLRDTSKNPRCGLLGILLPTHPDYGRREYNPRLMPPRLADNLRGSSPYAAIHDWTDNPVSVKGWINAAFGRRSRQPDPDNTRDQFGKNRSGPCSAGWQD